MKIRHKLSLLILGLSIILLSISSYVYYFQVKRYYLGKTYDHLEAVSQTKEIRLTDLIRKRNELIELLSRHDRITGQLKSKRTNSVHLAELMPILERFKRGITSLQEISIVDKEGRILVSTDATLSNKRFADEINAYKSQNRRIYWGNFYYSDGKLKNNLISIIGNSPDSLGYLIAITSADDIISLTNDYTGLGKTGETVLGYKDDSTILINSLRFKNSPPLNNKIDPMDSSYPMNRALTNKEGILSTAKDYRGEKVIASVRYVDELGWGLITKIDKNEAFEPIEYLTKILIIINVIAIIIISVISNIAAGFIARPIENLTKVVRQMKEGDLSARAKILSKDEIGTLSASFNEMATNLANKIEDLDSFIYTASHDLKAPISNIEGLLMAIEDDFSKQDIDKNDVLLLLSMIKQSILKFKGTVADLTQISRINKSFEDETADIIVIKDLIQDVLSLMENQIHENNAVINFDTSAAPLINFPKKHLSSILYNLISNAIKYKIPAINPIIDILTYKEPHYLVLEVKDNGLGIAMEDQKKAFVMFKRLHDHVEGSGIGLYLIKRIIDQYQGKIELISEPGKGSVFRIYFSLT